MCSDITYPFPTFNSCTVEVWEWITNFTPHFVMDEITYPYGEFKHAASFIGML